MIFARKQNVTETCIELERRITYREVAGSNRIENWESVNEGWTNPVVSTRTLTTQWNTRRNGSRISSGAPMNRDAAVRKVIIPDRSSPIFWLHCIAASIAWTSSISMNKGRGGTRIRKRVSHLPADKSLETILLTPRSYVGDVYTKARIETFININKYPRRSRG